MRCRLIADMPTEPAQQELAMRMHMFKEFTLRQDASNSPHSSTETIPIRALPLKEVSQDLWQQTTTAEDTEYAKHFPEVYRLAMDLMMFVRGKRLGAIMLVKLPTGKSIDMHSDEGLRAKYYDRFHVIVSGSCDWIESFGRTQMKEKDVWYVDNCEPHSVECVGDEDRVALIVDINR